MHNLQGTLLNQSTSRFYMRNPIEIKYQNRKALYLFQNHQKKIKNMMPTPHDAPMHDIEKVL